MSTASVAIAVVPRVEVNRLGDLGYGYMKGRGFRHTLCKQLVGSEPADAYAHEGQCEVKQLRELGLILRPQDDDNDPRSYTCTKCESVVIGDPFVHAQQKCSARGR